MKINTKHLYVMKKEDIPAFSKALAESFKDYPLFEYFVNGKYSLKKYTKFFEISLKQLGDNIIAVGDKKEPSAVAIFVNAKSNEDSIFSYIKNGGLALPFIFGLPAVIRMAKFEKFANGIKQKYITDNCYYFYLLVVKKELRGQSFASKLVKPILEYFDEHGIDCYLETFKEINIDKYQHYNFELKEVINVPKTNLSLKAMLRKSNKNLG
jgi:GNAT superfamily N-acetyltransferase